MKKSIILLLVAVSVFALVSCDHDGAATSEEEGAWVMSITDVNAGTAYYIKAADDLATTEVDFESQVIKVYADEKCETSVGTIYFGYDVEKGIYPATLTFVITAAGTSNPFGYIISPPLDIVIYDSINETLTFVKKDYLNISATNNISEPVTLNIIVKEACVFAKGQTE